MGAAARRSASPRATKRVGEGGDACITMGRDLAAVALAIVSTKDPKHFRTTPGGYFHGMVQKAKDGELHLERTIWALRRQARRGGTGGPG